MSTPSIEEALVATPPSSSSGDDAKPSLAVKNILNVVGLIANAVLVYGVGNAGWVGLTNSELSAKYQTIITPKGTAFSIWSVIYLFQAIFAVVQLLPRYRARPMVLDGAGYWYPLVCATQIGWTFAFALEVIPLSLTFMVLIWLSLVALLYSQYRAASDGTVDEFWLLRFPFMVHAGWITAATALNVNVQVVSMDQPAYVQLGVGIVSLAVLHAVSVWVLFNVPRPIWTIACVLSWAFGWIYSELEDDPTDLITNTFAEETIDGVQCASIAVAFIILIQIFVRLVLLVIPSWNPYKKVGDESTSTSVHDGENVKV